MSRRSSRLFAVLALCGFLQVSAGELCGEPGGGGVLLPLFWSDSLFSEKNPLPPQPVAPGECLPLGDSSRARLVAWMREGSEVQATALLLKGTRCGGLLRAPASEVRIPFERWKELAALWAGTDERVRAGLEYVLDELRAESGSGTMELSLGAAALRRETVRLGGAEPAAASLEQWWLALPDSGISAQCGDAAFSFPTVSEWSRTARGEGVEIALKVEGGERRIFAATRADGELFRVPLPLPPEARGVEAELRMPLDWPPLPRFLGGRWLDLDGNGRPDAAELRWSGVADGEKPPRVRLFSRTLGGSAEEPWAEWVPEERASSGDSLWTMSKSLPEWSSPLNLWPLPLSWNTVRAEVEWEGGTTTVNLADGVGPMLGAAHQIAGGIVLSFTEPVVGLRAGDVLFGREGAGAADAELERLSDDQWLLRVSETWPKGTQVRLSPEAAVVDRWGNLAPRNAPAVALTRDAGLLAPRPVRLECEHIAESRGEPPAGTFGKWEAVRRGESDAAAFDAGDGILAVRARIPLTSAFAERRAKTPGMPWTAAIYSAGGMRVASLNGTFECSALPGGCDPALGEELAVTIPWNLRDDSGRRVGSEAFIVQFNMLDGGKWLKEPLRCRVGVVRRDGAENLAR